MPVTNMTMNGGNFLLYSVCTKVAGEITALGSIVTHDSIKDLKYPIPLTTSEKEYITEMQDNGVELRVEKRKKTIDVKTGSEVTSGSGDKQKVTLNTFLSDLATIQILRALDGDDLVICFPYPKPADSEIIEGLGLLLCNLTGVIEPPSGSHSVGTIGLEFTETSGVAAALFDQTDVNTAFAVSVTPIGDSAVSLTPTLSAGDFTDLMAGKLVLVTI